MADLACFITGESLPGAAEQGHGSAAGGDPGSNGNGTGGDVVGLEEPAAGDAGSKPVGSRRRRWFSGLLRLLGADEDAGAQQLPWPQPPMRLTAKQHLSVMTHARLYGINFTCGASGLQEAVLRPAGAGASGGSGAGGDGNGGVTDTGLFSAVTGLPAGAAPTIAQRPLLKGRHADKVQLVRNYLGLAVIHAFEQRRVTAVKALQARGAATLDMDAQDQAWAYERELMLSWLDAVWSVFLQEVEALKKAVAVKTYGSSSPLAEFQLEANRTFLGMLATYREAVVAQVLVPDITVSTPLDDHEPDYLPSAYADADIIRAGTQPAAGAAGGAGGSGGGKA